MTRFFFVRTGFPGAGLVALALLVVAGAGCDKGNGIGSPRPGETLVLAVGDRSPVAGGLFTIRFSSVDEDSRCPLDVDCVQAGNGRVSLELQGSLAQPPVVVRLHTNAGSGPSSLVWDGYEVVLVSLDPYPDDSDTPIPPDEYRVSLRVDPAL